MLKKVNYKGKELLITYRNDVIFKRMLASSDEDSREILSFILEAVTKRPYRNVAVTNVECLGKYVLDKRHILDIRAEDEEGHIFNIEMQQSDLGKADMNRFQGYIYRIVGNEIDAGEDYEDMKPASQIVFTTGNFENQLITEYKQRQENGKEMPDNLASFYFISLPQIERIIEEKKKNNENLSNLEMISYIFNKDSNRAIIDIVDDRQRRVVNLMEKKYNESVERSEVLDEAAEAAYYEKYLRGKRNQYLREGLQQGEFKEALSKTQKLIIGLYKEDSDWLSECTLEQINIAFDLALKNVDYDELKNKVLNK